jgi:hypothetical protein
MTSLERLAAIGSYIKCCVALCMHVLPGWVGGSVAHHAHLLEQTKSSVVVVTNNRGVLWMGGWVCLLGPQLAASYAPVYQGWAIMAAWPQACCVALDVLGPKLKITKIIFDPLARPPRLARGCPVRIPRPLL